MKMRSNKRVSTAKRKRPNNDAGSGYNSLGGRRQRANVRPSRDASSGETRKTSPYRRS